MALPEPRPFSLRDCEGMMDVALVSPTEADAITIYEAYRQDHEPDLPKARPFGDQWLTHPIE